MATVIRTSDELRRYAMTNIEEPIAEAEFRAGFSALLERAPAGLVRGHTFFSLPAAASTWLDTGIDLLVGDAVTLFATARPQAVSQPGARTSDDPRILQLAATEAIEALRGVWFRIGADGQAHRGPRSAVTFTASSPGRLYLVTAPVVDRATASDKPRERPVYALPAVDRFALVLQWAGDPVHGIETLRAGGDVGGLLDCEIARQQTAIELPEGWEYAPKGSECELFAADLRRSDAPIIACYSHSSGALLQKDAALRFRPGTKLAWSWKVDELPSPVREDRLATHNYLSIAVEFCNGHDLTYYWSSELPVETAYACPVPGWEHRETHVVVRSGPDGLGHWIDEERDLYADYLRHVGAPPSAIVRVWLLASTLRGRTDGRCEYGRVELANGSTRARVN